MAALIVHSAKAQRGVVSLIQARLREASADQIQLLEGRLERYVPRAVLASLSRTGSREGEKWANETASAVVLFANLGITDARLRAAARDDDAAHGSRFALPRGHVGWAGERRDAARARVV